MFCTKTSNQKAPSLALEFGAKFGVIFGLELRLRKLNAIFQKFYTQPAKKKLYKNSDDFCFSDVIINQSLEVSIN